MSTPPFISITDQVAGHLRSEILRGRWSGTLPGKHLLAAELGVNNKTIQAAMRQLEQSGLLLPQGAGRCRLINLPHGHRRHTRSLRIALLVNDKSVDEKNKFYLDYRHALEEAGHTIVSLPHSLTDLRFDPTRVAALVRQTKADAWIIGAGSRAVLEWFANQPVPAFALFGNRVGLKIPSVGPSKAPIMAEATQHLIALGHRRITLLTRRAVRLPNPAPGISTYLDTLRQHGLQPSEFNLPDWEETNAGFHECLRSLFKATPPTALIVDEATYFIATMQFLLKHHLSVPDDVSIISTDDDIALSRCDPPVACIRWDFRPVVRRIVSWAANVSRGKADFTQTLTPAEFVPGDTVGRASHLVRR